MAGLFPRVLIYSVIESVLVDAIKYFILWLNRSLGRETSEADRWNGSVGAYAAQQDPRGEHLAEA